MIIGFNFRKINIERKKKLTQGMKVKYDMDISNVYEQDIAMVAEKNKVLGFDFDFKIAYGPDIADLGIFGSVMYMFSDEEAKKTLDLWKKSRKLSKSVSVPIINMILDKCNIKALELEQDLALPTHLPMPSVNLVGKDDSKAAEKYIG